MYYEINVCKLRKNGYAHFFATAERSLTTKAELKEALEEFVKKFPKPEYELSVTLDKQIKKGINIDKILNTY